MAIKKCTDYCLLHVAIVGSKMVSNISHQVFVLRFLNINAKKKKYQMNDIR